MQKQRARCQFFTSILKSCINQKHTIGLLNEIQCETNPQSQGIVHFVYKKQNISSRILAF
jgi:hypothetical protein